jgi:putative iron-dependent peroxidase
MLSDFSQPAILIAGGELGRGLSFRLDASGDARAALMRLRDGFSPHWGAVGLGEPLLRALGVAVPGLRAFPALAGPGCAIPSAQHALWLMLTAADRSMIFDRMQAVLPLIEPAFVLEDAIDTFRYGGGRDLSGYEDGTENPKGDAAVEAALVAEGNGLAGSSFVAVQRWEHDLRRFAAHAPEERDAMIGRRRDDNEELADAPPSAHVKRSAQESYAPAAFMLRRSMPWSTGARQGLEFVAYGASLDAFERVLRRMAGLEDGVVDALFRFSRPLTGAYYWCPPVAADRLDLSLLGL